MRGTLNYPEIPHGYYCYDENGICPHWQKTENGALCNLLNEEHFTHCWNHLVWDQVKECGINKSKSIIRSPEELIQLGYYKTTIICECDKEVEIWQWDNPKYASDET